MSLSAPQQAVLLALGDLPPGGWSASVVLERALAHPGGASITNRTIASLTRRCLVFVTDEPGTGLEPTLELTTSGRARLRAGLTTDPQGPTT